ncbi:cytochrome P460 family protein [Vibrio parahaemolyticus]|uniref:cytochrome P460 family protein n=1 Tax=Vibrio parahaemolyticus TaxID=670 RepID=UPI003AADCE5D
MKLIAPIISCCLLALSAAVHATSDLASATYSQYVDDKGNMTLPEEFDTQWTFVGTWVVDHREDTAIGAEGIHNVYTQPDVVKHYQQHGTFPDGAIFIKELLEGHTKAMTTGNITFAGKKEGWFMMVKDTKGRFKDNLLWGDGWGWALFNADAPDKVVTQNYRMECLGCHIPAQPTDWIYVEGYPLFNTAH